MGLFGFIRFPGEGILVIFIILAIWGILEILGVYIKGGCWKSGFVYIWGT